MNYILVSEGRRGSSQSDTSALVSSITQDLSQSPSQVTHAKDLSPSPSGSSVPTHSGSSPVNATATKVTVRLAFAYHFCVTKFDCYFRAVNLQG